MALKILCAGGSKEEKEAVETAVRAGIGSRPAAESWMVSLVKIGRQWSVTLDGPEKSQPRATFMAPEGGLREAIADSIARRGSAGPAPGGGSAGGPAKAAGAPAGATAGDALNAYKCRKCGKGFVVTYDVVMGDPLTEVPAACPHCWQIEQVKVGATAAVNNDYRVEKT